MNNDSRSIPKSTLLHRLLARFPESGVLIVFVLTALVFTLGLALQSLWENSSPSSFAGLENTTSILTRSAVIGIIACGVSLLMIAGEFDISVGSVMVLAIYVFTGLTKLGFSPPVAMNGALLAGAAAGLVNGLITLLLNIPSFITTLGTMLFWRGIVIYLLAGSFMSYQGNEEWLAPFGSVLFSQFRMSVVWFFAVAGILQIILVRTPFGNWTFAAGGDAQAARNVGVPVYRVKLICFTLCGALSALAGISYVARYKTMQVSVGQGFELEAIAAAVIGGNMLTGGCGSILGTVIGVVFVSMIRNGLIHLLDSSYLHYPVTGVLLIIAVIINRKISALTL